MPTTPQSEPNRSRPSSGRPELVDGFGEPALRRPEGGSAPPTARGAPFASQAGRRPAAIVALAILVWLAATAGLRPLALPDEGRYVGIAREMLHSGDWLTPTLDGLPYFHKPPLFYWITAASMAAFGENAWTARAAPIAGTWAAAFALFLFARRWAGERLARFATIALLSMPLVYLGGQYANMDMLVAGLIAATVLLLAGAALAIETGRPHRRALLAAYAVGALGVLAKGLIGVALPMLTVIAWLLLRRRSRTILPMLSAAGALLFFAIALPWFVAMQMRFSGFLDYFFIVQQVKRFAEAGFNNVRPFWFYPAVLLLASLPWLPWFVRLCRLRGSRAAPTASASASASAPTSASASASVSSWTPMSTSAVDGAAPGAVRGLMLVWLLVVTVFFSIPRSKLPGYIFPVVPTLAFFAADALFALGAPTLRLRRLWATSAVVSALLGLGGVLVFTLHPYRSARPLALALAHARAPGDPVFMLNEFYFDVPFYARLDTPVQVVDDWTSPDIQAHDNWRKEMADADGFRRGSVASPLVTPAQLPARLCASRTNWLIGPGGSVARYPFLSATRVVASTPEATLWRLDSGEAVARAALACGR